MWNDDKRFETIELRIAQPAPAATKSSTPAASNNAAAKGCEKPTIKGNVESKIYHVPGGQYYEKTTKNIKMFCSEEEAQAAGYRKSQR